MPGCPSCGSMRWRGAPMAVVSGAIGLIGRHRYRCAQCSRISWQRPMRRTASIVTAIEHSDLRGGEMAFAATVLLAVFIGLIFSVQSCERLPGDPERPPEQPPVTSVLQ